MQRPQKSIPLSIGLGCIDGRCEVILYSISGTAIIIPHPVRVFIFKKAHVKKNGGDAQKSAKIIHGLPKCLAVRD